MEKPQNKTNVSKYRCFVRILCSMLFILCLILVLGYALSAFIIEKAIRSNLPDNVILTDFKSDFPGLSQITIDNLEFDIDGNQVLLNDLTVSYEHRGISLGSVLVILKDGKDKNDNSSGLFSRELLILPKIDLTELVHLNKIEDISIDRFNIHRRNKQTSFNNTHFQKLDKNNFRITSHKLDNDDLNTETINSIELTISTDNSSRLDLYISVEGSQLARLSYHSQSDQNELKLHLTDFSLFNEMGLVDKAAPFSEQSTIELIWSSDFSQKLSVVELKAQLNPSKTALDSLGIEGYLGGKETFPILTEIKLIANKDEAITLKGFVDSNSPIELVFDSTLLNILGARLSFETSINEERSSINNIILLAPKSQLDIDGLSVNLPEGLRVDLKKLVLKSTGEQIHLYINRKEETNFDSLALLGNELSLNNTLEVELITGTYSPLESDINEIVNFSSKLSSDFDISKEQGEIINASGRLSLDNLVMKKLDDFIDSKLELSWEHIDKSLSSGTARISLTSENTTIAGVSIESISTDVKLLFEDNKTTGIGKMVLNDKLVSPFNFYFDKQNSNFIAQFKNNKLDLQMLNPFLSALGKQDKLELNILSGYSKQSTKLSLKDTLALTSSLLIEDMLFAFGENTISGLDIKQEIKSVNPLAFELDLSIDEVNFNSGLLVSNIECHIVGVSAESIVISSLTADIFEGALSFDAVEVKNNTVQPSVVKLSSISLTELIFFMDVAGLYAEGLLD
ncbi:MAG: YdbH domain-containing protein, partial [Kangiellaceae bacterium]|nr:YdbH domain-containing protein [Kangiellaceae bacterium]